MSKEQQVTISKLDYELLKMDSLILEILTERGVDDWPGSEGAVQLALERYQKENNE